MRIFFGGPLTDLAKPEQTKEFYKKMAQTATKNSVECYWAFLRGTDPELNPDVAPARVFQIDTYELEKSDVMIAYVGEPSTGTGQEIEYAREHEIPVYLLFPKGFHVSRMLLGSPNVRGTIEYETEEQALIQLDLLIKSLLPK
jgi:2'-deoxynucleoside 5'-phosphate N-hydrolase